MYKKYSDLPRDEPRTAPRTAPREEPRTTPTQPQQECACVISAEQKQQIIQSHRVVVVDVYGNWCGPCNTVAPEYLQLSQEFSRPGDCAIVKENVDDGFTPEVGGVPAFFFYYNGEEVDQVTGANIPLVREKLNELLRRR